MKHLPLRTICAAMLPLLAGMAAAQPASAASSDPHAAFDTFCASHADECAVLKQLHETERSVCGNDSSTVGQCREARDNVRAEMKKLQAEGLPQPPGPPPGGPDGMGPGGQGPGGQSGGQ